jgi:flagellar biosynthesis protein FliR
MLPNDINALFALFVVFVRCSAAVMSSPLFGAQNTPVQIRVFTSLAISAAISVSVKTNVGPAPEHLGRLIMVLMNEVGAGLLIGMLLSLSIQFAQMAGSFLDMQIGLGMSQTLNPVFGISVTILGQVKTMLAIMVFLAMNGHHYVIGAIIKSYSVAPTLTMSDLGILKSGVMLLITQGSMVALQIAAPVLGVSLIVDAALGLMTKAMPQLQPIQIGMPAKLALGISAVSLCLPALVAATQSGVERSFDLIGRIFGS